MKNFVYLQAIEVFIHMIMKRKLIYRAPALELSAAEAINRLCEESVVCGAANSLLLINEQKVTTIDYNEKNDDGSSKFNQVWE